MKNLFAASQHYVMIELRKKNITFPTTKDNILAKAGQESIRIDWDKYVSLSEYCKNIKIENFVTKAMFFNAVLGSNTVY